MKAARQPANLCAMHRIITTVLISILLAQPVWAQSYAGNWGCTANGITAGMLTIYGDGYGFASATFGDKSSGIGTINGYTDGVGFADGPLLTNGGIVAARLVNDPTVGTAMQLESSSDIVMVCTPR
ncbi:hypothetical protein PSQ90_12290 [Devosia rhodophyticola]|uniref:Uncharacterized protein n=1 Tax=Devosia rhodophyticola TaxID=3026423 RepID=A0ABY7YUS2_9HYPH|nr:hypothetical protein [Devosia rhodophyticola]WDR05066.1 hypothetical protein PSQ90_12290 [Devosia rhodophyticola]